MWLFVFKLAVVQQAAHWDLETFSLLLKGGRLRKVSRKGTWLVPNKRGLDSSLGGYEALSQLFALRLRGSNPKSRIQTTNRGMCTYVHMSVLSHVTFTLLARP